MLPLLLKVFSQIRPHRTSQVASILITSAPISSKAFRSKQTPTKQNNRSKPIPAAPTIDVFDGISISEISKLTKRPLGAIIRSVNSGLLGSLRVNASTAIEDRELLIGLVSLLGFRTRFVGRNNSDAGKKKINLDNFDAFPRPPPDPSICVPRPPVVAIMGHVDHGKTTLLDALRSSRIVDTEFGGITQHISTFSLSIREAIASASGSTNNDNSTPPAASASNSLEGGVITFIDTPGHAAFSAMRARGAQATDIVLLVVAADDGVMPQTVESIKFARQSNAQIVVAINKMDRHGVDADRAIEGLASNGVIVEKLGGDIQAIQVSALRRHNLVALLEAITAQAEVMQICADPTGPAEAIVLECRTEVGIGKVVNCLVTRGQLKHGSHRSGPLVAGESIGCTRVLRNDRGVAAEAIGPGYTAIIAGWKSMPPVGSILLELDNEADAEAVVRARRQRRLTQKSETDKTAIDKKMATYNAAYDAYLGERRKMNVRNARRFASEFRRSNAGLSALLAGSPEDEVTLPLLVKADVEGSLEAIVDMLATAPRDQCNIQIVSSGVGPVTAAEVDLSVAIGAEVFAFNVDALPDAERALEAHGIALHNHNIIYRLAEDVRGLINDKLPPTYVEEIVGEGLVIQVFEVTVTRGKRHEVMVGGCRCTRGNIFSGKSSKHGSEPILFRVLRPSPQGPLRQRHTTTITKSKTCSPKGRGGVTVKDDDSDAAAAAPADPLANSRILINNVPCSSLRHGRNDVESVRRDVEFGIILMEGGRNSGSGGGGGGDGALAELYANPPQEGAVAFSDWTLGDVVQCYRIVKKAQFIEWHIDNPQASA